METKTSPRMHGADTVAEQISPLRMMVPAQQSFAVRPGPRLEQPEPPHVPQPNVQQIPEDSTPTSPLLQVDIAGAGVGPGVGDGVGTGVWSIGAGVGAGVGSPMKFVDISMPVCYRRSLCT